MAAVKEIKVGDAVFHERPWWLRFGTPYPENYPEIPEEDYGVVREIYDDLYRTYREEAMIERWCS